MMQYAPVRALNRRCPHFTRWLIGSVASAIVVSAQAAAPVPGPDGHLYRHLPGGYHWTEAWIIAADSGWYDQESGVEYIGQLASITSDAENAFVAGLTGGAAAWLGATVVDAAWTWRGGADDGLVVEGYSNWAPGWNDQVVPEHALRINHAGYALWSSAMASGPDAPWHGFVIEYVPVTAAVPEPAPTALLLAGLATLVLLRRRH
jgi:hypothetical protein